MWKRGSPSAPDDDKGDRSDQAARSTSRLLKPLQSSVEQQKMLIPQLRELESAGVFAGKAYPVVPPQVEYPLAKDGLASILFT